jgi:hypothetical protein
VATNPSTPDYLEFLRTQLLQALTQKLDRVDSSLSSDEQKLVRTLVQAQGPRLVDSLIGPNTIRRNYGLFSVFETTALDSRVVVVGIGRRFIPVTGVEEASLKLGQRTFSTGAPRF